MNKMPTTPGRSGIQPETLLEEGDAFMKLAGLEPSAPGGREHLDVVVIGGGQAGLSVGHHLARHGLRFAILDAEARVGDAWRKRWDSLRLFTPARFDSLDGMPFPAAPTTFPTKDEMADYLEAYAAHFRLPVRSGIRVERLTRRDGRFLLTAGGREISADQVVVAMASYQVARQPAFAAELDPAIRQLHSSAYRSPAQLREGSVLIAGAGNSGAEIGLELTRHGRSVVMAGPDTGQVPFRLDSLPGRTVLGPLVLRGLFHRLFTIRTPIGRKVRPKFLHRGGPLIRVKNAQLRAAGVERVARVTGVQDGLPLLSDGRTLPVANVVWCTGYRPGFSWIDLPLFDDHGDPFHEGGVCPGQPGLYFVGLHFLYSVSSTMIHGVGRDAARIVDALVAYHSASTGNTGNTVNWKHHRQI